MTISNCGHDENNKYRGGKAGDQSGTEWYVRNWYNGGWKYVLRHPDTKTRALIAEMARNAANNNHIGYDQNERLTFWTQLKAANYRPENITKNCEADCSSGVAAIVKGAGYRLGNSKMQGVNTSIYTGNEKTALSNAGFTVLSASKYLTSDAYLLEGDILLSGGHTCINLTNGGKSSIVSSITSALFDKTPDTVLEVQIYCNKVWGANLEEDGIAGKNTKGFLVKKIQELIDTKVDGIFGKNSQAKWGKLVIKKGSKGDIVRVVQMMLICKGYSIGSGGADSECGNDTANGIKKFQQDNGLIADKECGKDTAAKLFA